MEEESSIFNSITAYIYMYLYLVSFMKIHVQLYMHSLQRLSIRIHYMNVYVHVYSALVPSPLGNK